MVAFIIEFSTGAIYTNKSCRTEKLFRQNCGYPKKSRPQIAFLSFKFMKFNYRLRIYVDKYDLIPAVLNRIECIWGNYERKA